MAWFREPVRVELIDGRVVASDDEAHKRECLARLILRKPVLEQRAWLAEHEERHGAEDAKQLHDAMTAIQGKGTVPR